MKFFSLVCFSLSVGVAVYSAMKGMPFSTGLNCFSACLNLGNFYLLCEQEKSI